MRKRRDLVVKLLKSSRKGFTLIELLAVIVILAILGAVAVYTLLGSNSADAKASHLGNDIQDISHAIQRFYMDTTEFPSAIKQLWTGKDSSGNPIVGYRGPYLQPSDPTDETVKVSYITSDTTIDVECQSGEDANAYEKIKITNVPLTIAKLLDKNFDDGDKDNGRITYDDTTDPTTVYYLQARGDWVKGGITCVP